MHFCADELMALMALIPGLGLLVTRLRAWWHARHTPQVCAHAEEHAE